MSCEHEIVVRLTEQKEALWRQFANHTNEMIFNKIGRKINPPLEYDIKGLDARKMYEIVLEIYQVDDLRYGFYKDQWLDISRSIESSYAANEKIETIAHVDGLQTGDYWMMDSVSFDHVKLTTDPKSTNPSHIFLRSKHKYIPVLTINEVTSILNPVAVVSIDYTQFIAVTSYQNKTVKSLKTTTNPSYYQNNKRHQTCSSPEVPPKQAKPDILSPVPHPFPITDTFMLPVTTHTYFSNFNAYLGWIPNVAYNTFNSEFPYADPFLAFLYEHSEQNDQWTL